MGWLTPGRVRGDSRHRWQPRSRNRAEPLPSSVGLSAGCLGRVVGASPGRWCLLSRHQVVSSPQQTQDCLVPRRRQHLRRTPNAALESRPGTLSHHGTLVVRRSFPLGRQPTRIVHNGSCDTGPEERRCHAPIKPRRGRLTTSPTAQLGEATKGRMWWSEPATPPDRDTEACGLELVVDERGVVM
jgi:hypothetical protein